jgi:hypothetical protein
MAGCCDHGNERHASITYDKVRRLRSQDELHSTHWQLTLCWPLLAVMALLDSAGWCAVRMSERGAHRATYMTATSSYAVRSAVAGFVTNWKRFGEEE